MLADRLKMGAAGVEAADGGNDSYTKLLMHMEGTDDAQVFTDSSVGNLVKIDSGGLGDGFGVFNGTDAYLSVADSADWTLGDTFTIELWVKFDSATGDKVFVSQETNADNRWMFYWLSTGVLRWYDRIGGGNNIVDSDAWTPILGQWYHIALSKNGTKAYFFIDGVDSGDPNDASAVQNLTEDLIIGMNESNSAADNFFPGSMDELRISNVARYTEAFTPSTTAFTSDANTKLLLHMDLPNTDPQSFVDSGNTTHTVTDNGGVYQKATDLGIIGDSCGYFDGTGAKLTLADSTDWDFGTGDFTIEYWIYYLSGGSYQTIYDNNYTAASSILLQTNNAAAPKLICYINGGAGAITEGTAASLRTWHHYAVVRTSGTVKIYRDGVETATGTLAGDIDTGVQVAWFAEGTAGANATHAHVDEIRVTTGTAAYTANFNPPVTAFTSDANTKLLLHFNNGEGSVAFDDDGNTDHTVTANGNAIQVIGHGADAAADVKTENTQKKFGTTSAYFDGTGDYLSTGVSADFDAYGSDFTIEFWIYPSSVAATIRYVTFETNGAAQATGIQLDASSHISVGDYGVSNLTGTTVIVVNQWQHIAITKSSGTTYIFVDGVLDNSGVYEPFSNSGNRYAIIGESFYASAEYTGYMDELRISKGIARWTANFTPPTAAYY